jgi:hypothetical protein
MNTKESPERDTLPPNLQKKVRTLASDKTPESDCQMSENDNDDDDDDDDEAEINDTGHLVC